MVVGMVIDVLLYPGKFFKKVKREKGFKKPVTFFSVMLLVPFMVGLLSGRTLINQIMGYILGFLAFFGITIIIHFSTKLFRSDGYEKTLKAISYGSTPGLLFGWIPGLGFLFGLYSLFLGAEGLSILHKIDFKYSSVSVGATFLLVFGAALFFF